MACKVDSDLMMDFVAKSIKLASDKRREMHINKHKYCVFKNDLVLCTNKPLFPSNNNKSGHRQNAYPAVVSTLGDVELCCKKFLAQYYSYHSAIEQLGFHMTASQNTDKMKHDFQDNGGLILNLPYFSAQGYALGTAWASDQTGDTVSSVLVGGMQTVMNGAFPCCAGEVLQWYFEFEEDMYYPKRIQVPHEDFHRESASRKYSGEDIDHAILYELLQHWNMIDENGVQYNMNTPKGRELLDHLVLSKANFKEGTIEYMETDHGKRRDNNQFTLPGDSTLYHLQGPDQQNNVVPKSLTDLMKSGVVNSASKFQTSYHIWNADTKDMDTKVYPESYNKGDTLRKRRREFNERMDGLGAEQKGNKPYPKPYRLYCTTDGSGHPTADDHYGDKIRIFAKCVSSARPHEMMDIMLMTQSL